MNKYSVRCTFNIHDGDFSIISIVVARSCIEAVTEFIRSDEYLKAFSFAGCEPADLCIFKMEVCYD